MYHYQLVLKQHYDVVFIDPQSMNEDTDVQKC